MIAKYVKDFLFEISPAKNYNNYRKIPKTNI